MTERVGRREAIRLKLARVVGVRHDGGGEGSARPERRLRLWERLRLQERVQRRRLELELHLIRAVRRDRQEAARPCGQGGPASPEPAAVQKRITPARACGRLAARHSEALLRVVAVEHARLRDLLVQLLAEARAARQERRPTLEQYADPQLTRKVWEGLLRFHRQLRAK